jgi:hypothetical protein
LVLPLISIVPSIFSAGKIINDPNSIPSMFSEFVYSFRLIVVPNNKFCLALPLNSVLYLNDAVSLEISKILSLDKSAEVNWVFKVQVFLSKI